MRTMVINKQKAGESLSQGEPYVAFTTKFVFRANSTGDPSTPLLFFQFGLKLGGKKD